MNRLFLLASLCFLFLYCYTARDIKVDNTNDNINFCIKKNADSIIPNILGINSLICDQSKFNSFDTIININSSIINLFDSVNIKSIQECVKNNNKSLILTYGYKFPYIVLTAYYENCKYYLKIGVMNGELAGHGEIYELEKRIIKFIIGKSVDLWVS
jgi:hypothetical protein